MRIKITIFGCILILLLSSCILRDDNSAGILNTIFKTHENISEIYEITSIASTTTTSIILEKTELAENKEIQILSPFGIYGMGDSERSTVEFVLNGLPLEFFSIVDEPEFISLVSEIDYKKWDGKYRDKYIEWEKEWGIYIPIGTSMSHDETVIRDFKSKEKWTYQHDISDTPNFYTFVCDFNLSEMQIKQAMSKIMKSPDRYAVTYRWFTDEQINAVCQRNKSEIVKLFAEHQTIVKGDKFYTMGWFFYASPEEYKQEGITLDDLFLLNIKTSFESEYYTFLTPYFYDRIQRNIYEFADGDINIIKLCGYERDFSMPLAYEYLLYGYQKNDKWFYNKIYYDDDGEKVNEYCITKNTTPYSPHWVYYNLSSAYKEAGITPAELQEMLPKYKELGILSEEAIVALENKINNYTG